MNFLKFYFQFFDEILEKNSSKWVYDEISYKKNKQITFDSILADFFAAFKIEMKFANTSLSPNCDEKHEKFSFNFFKQRSLYGGSDIQNE